VEENGSKNGKKSILRGKFLDIFEVWINNTSFFHIHDRPHHKFNE